MPNQLSSLDQVFQALADPTRRGMVERLVRGPASVSELSRPLAMSLPAVMQHLQVLEACGLVRSEKACGVRTCHIEPAALRAAEAWIASQRTAWERRLDRLGEYLAERPRRPRARSRTRPGRPQTREQLTMDRYVTHATFSLERSYPLPPARVFAAWADPAAKASWFAAEPDAGHQLDFRVGGRELVHGGPDGGPVMTFESIYRDIVPQERIVYTSTLATGNDVMTVSLTTVEFRPAEGGTRLVLTEQGTFLDGREEPAWREHGTAAQLDALSAELTEEHR